MTVCTRILHEKQVSLLTYRIVIDPIKRLTGIQDRQIHSTIILVKVLYHLLGNKNCGGTTRIVLETKLKVVTSKEDTKLTTETDFEQLGNHRTKGTP